jgi:hypothetical protein
LSLGPEEQGRRQLLPVEAVGQVEQVGHKEDRDAAVKQGVDDLPGDLGALALVGGRERLVAQQHRVGRDGVGDLAHPTEFLDHPKNTV